MSGGSRASKKRARTKLKKEQQQQQQQEQTQKKQEQQQQDQPPKKQQQQQNQQQQQQSQQQQQHEQQKQSDNPSQKRNASITEKHGSKKIKASEDFTTLVTDHAPNKRIDVLNEEFLFKNNLLKILNNVAEAPVEDMTAVDRARLVFGALLHPATNPEAFYNDYWETKPLWVDQSRMRDRNEKHHHRTRFDGMLSVDGIHQLLNTQSFRYGKDLTITKYVDSGGVKKRINYHDDSETKSDGEEYSLIYNPESVWSKYENSGCTLRLLCPQKYVDSIHCLLSTLELEWGCMVGANAYLTPPNLSQGFAPHYDDVDVFILQLEGIKHWTIYAPQLPHHKLPRVSSRDFNEDDLSKPYLEATLHPGDMLYLPRGWIHQAHTIEKGPDHVGKKGDGSHIPSLHLTVSCMQRWSWIDFMEGIFPRALESCSLNHISFRQGLPRNFLDYMGLMHQNDDKNMGNNEKGENDIVGEDGYNEGYSQAILPKKQFQRNRFKEEAKKRIMRVCKEAISMLDDGCDDLGVRFLADRLPPALSQDELMLTSDCESKDDSVGSLTEKAKHISTKLKVKQRILQSKILPNTLCRIVRPNIARVVVETLETESNEEESTPKAVLYHCIDNSREYHGGIDAGSDGDIKSNYNQPLPLEFEIDDAPAIETLLTTVEPHWVCVSDLFHETGCIEDKCAIAQTLFDDGLLALWNPMLEEVEE